MEDNIPNIGIIQHNPKIGDLSGNYKKVKNQYEKMSANDIDLVVTPELCLIGYPPRDLLHRKSLLKKERSMVNKLKDKTVQGPAIVIGHTSNNSENGPPLKNSASVFKDGREVTSYNKRLLPTYDVFDEHRYFKKGESSSGFTINGNSIGITICEDAWYDHYVTDNQRHSYNPVADYSETDIIVNLSASPFKINKFKNREKRFTNHARNLNSVFIFANQVGGNDDILFDGTSFIVNSNGDTVYRAPFGSENSCKYKTGNGIETELYNIPSETRQLRTILSLGITDYISKTGFESVVVGLSGGIDSTVTANLAVEALGKENVYGITLPSSVTTRKNKTDAKRVSQNLGIKFDELAISEINDKYLEKIQNKLSIDNLRSITKENIQARIRGDILMAVANENDTLVLTPDNKSEAAVGYCTLYGDAIGAIGPLGDCTKDRVYELAKLFNEKPPNRVSDSPIPKSVIQKEPTAELSEDQKDTDDIPSYDTIDPVVKMYVEEDKTVQEIVSNINASRKDVIDVVTRITRSEFKRKQSPPALRVTDKAFDSGWRYPIAASYNPIISD